MGWILIVCRAAALFHAGFGQLLPGRVQSHRSDRREPESKFGAAHGSINPASDFFRGH
jgi:hypothetical protein